MRPISPPEDTGVTCEQALVNANRELIVRLEQKIQATLARVWGKELNPADDEDKKAA